MRAYALVELGDHESIDLFLREEDARRALEGSLIDEPDWAGLFYAPVRVGRAGRVAEPALPREAELGPETDGCLQQSADGRVSHPFEPLILAATLAMIPVLIIE